MTTPDGTIKVDTAALNNIAQQLEQLAATLSSSAGECGGINAQVETGAAAFIADRQPNAVYNTVVADTKAVGTRMQSEVEQLIDQLKGDAEACRQLAEAHVDDEQKNADTIGAVDATKAGGTYT